MSLAWYVVQVATNMEDKVQNAVAANISKKISAYKEAKENKKAEEIKEAFGIDKAIKDELEIQEFLIANTILVPKEKIEEIINTGEYNSLREKKKESQFFPTPIEVVLQIIEMANIEQGNKVLEPSCGRGAIVSEVVKDALCFIVESDKENYEFTLKSYACSAYNNNGNVDFLTIAPKQDFDRVIMNPPFRNQQDISHVLHAFKFLKPGGILVSVVSESPFFRNNTKSVEFRNWLTRLNAEYEILSEGAFKESGTMIKTRIIKVVKS